MPKIKKKQSDFYFKNDDHSLVIDKAEKIISEMRDMFLLEDDKKIKRNDNGAAHITLSHKKGYKQGDANSMFTKPDLKIKRYGYVEGKVKYFKYG